MFNLNDMEHSFCYIMNKRYYFKIVNKENLKKYFGLSLKLGREYYENRLWTRNESITKDYCVY